METESRKLFSDGYGLDTATKGYFFKSYAQDPKTDANNPLISPLFAENLAYMPPTHIITAECDPLRDEGKLLADRLNKDGVQCPYKCYAGMLHGFLSYQYQVPMDAATEAVSGCAAQLRKHLCR